MAGFWSKFLMQKSWDNAKNVRLSAKFICVDGIEERMYSHLSP